MIYNKTHKTPATVSVGVGGSEKISENIPINISIFTIRAVTTIILSFLLKKVRYRYRAYP